MLSDYAKRDAEIIRLQNRLLDYTGHVRPELTVSQARRLVGKINRLRHANGWRSIDMKGRRG